MRLFYDKIKTKPVILIWFIMGIWAKKSQILDHVLTRHKAKKKKTCFPPGLIHGVCLWYFKSPQRRLYLCLSNLPQLGLKCIHEDRLEATVAEVLHFGSTTLR